MKSESRVGEGTILIVDDEHLIRWSLQECLKPEGYETHLAENGHDALEAFDRFHPDLIILDICLPDTDGLQILKSLKAKDPSAIVIMVTAHSSVDTAIEALKLGAYDYIEKPFDIRALKHAIGKSLEAKRLQNKVTMLESRQKELLGLDNIIGNSPSMLAVYETVAKVARNNLSTVLILGENGTGKDLFARAIHDKSEHPDAPFMEVNCASIPEHLFESELFGHEKGSFTDAKAQRKGLFELAANGTIFLDEIGEMAPSIQAKLLRAIENRRFRRVGGTQDLEVNARIIAATNKDLDREVEKGTFRQDLYFRLKVIPICLPPLRERVEDIPELVYFFIGKFNRAFKKEVRGVSEKALERIRNYSWPGNVRELKNTVERIMILEAEDMILEEHLPLELRDPGEATFSLRGERHSPYPFSLPAEGMNLEDVERGFIEQAMSRSKGNQSRAARLLGISRHTLRYRLEKFGLATLPTPPNRRVGVPVVPTVESAPNSSGRVLGHLR